MPLLSNFCVCETVELLSGKQLWILDIDSNTKYLDSKRNVIQVPKLSSANCGWNKCNDEKNTVFQKIHYGNQKIN